MGRIINITLFLVIFPCSLLGCERIDDITSDSALYQQYKRVDICTSSNMFIYEMVDPKGRPYSFGAYLLRGPSGYGLTEETVDQHKARKWSEFSGVTGIGNITLVEKGSVIRIENVYHYRKFMCCEFYPIMASLTDESLGELLVDVSIVFREDGQVVDSWGHRGIDREAQLVERFAHVCQ